MAEPKCPECGANDKWSWEQETYSGVLSASLNAETGRYELTDFEGETGETTYTCAACDFTCDHDEYEELER